MNKFLRPLIVALALILAGMSLPASDPAHAAPNFPKLTGRVVDDANVLSPQVEAELTEKLATLEASTQRQLVVATLKSLDGQEIEEYGYQLGRAWGIGRAGKNDGALFIVAPNDRKVRIEVGYGLEPVLTDALSSVILTTRVIPKFKAGDISGGVVDGTSAIADQLALPEGEAKAQVARAAEPQRHHKRSSGLGGIIPIIIFFVIFSLIFGRRGRRSSGLGGALPWIILGALSNSRSSGGDWGGGGGGWGGGGGGGFSGGGGSFGGGGSSGGW